LFIAILPGWQPNPLPAGDFTRVSFLAEYINICGISVLLFLLDSGRLYMRHYFILSACKPARFYHFGKNARLCFACLQASIEVVSQQWEPCVFRAWSVAAMRFLLPELRLAKTK
jgi:hypothetical protein